jgi:hypothetical protein
MRIWKFLLSVSLLGAGATAVACSSSSSPATGGNDAATDTGVVTGEDAAAEAAGPCVLLPASPATVDGGTAWACYQKTCAAAFATCAADCVCNNALVTALSNIATMGMTMAIETAQLTPVDAIDDAGAGAIGCVVSNESVCMPIVSDAGKADGGDAATGDSATASDAPAEGG